MAVSFPAFLNDDSVKAQALAHAAKPAAQGDVWWPVNFDQAAIGAYCDDNGLHPAFFYLVRALAGPSGEGEVSAALGEVLDAVPAGVDTRDLLRRWLMWLWDGRGAASLEAVLKGSAGAGPAAALVALHASDAPVSRQAWRQARNALAAVEGLTPEQGAAVETVAAMGWDFDTTPGAGTDLVHTCFGEASKLIDLEMGWSEEHSNAFHAAITRQFAVARDELGDPPADRSDREVMTAYTDAFYKIAEREATEAEREIRARMEKVGAVKGERGQALSAALRDGLKAQARDVARVAA